MIAPFTSQERIAYFTMEIALRSDIPTYAGGLGVLAGDMIRSAADCELPMVTVTLVSRRGYFRQEIDQLGRQVEKPDGWDPARFARRLGAQIAVPIEGREVWVGAWLYVLEGVPVGREPVILLDTDLDQNSPADREITHHLYGGDAAYRLKQEIVLGIGGVRMLEALSVRVRQFHLNEGHSALLTLELLRRHAFPAESVRPGEARYNVQQVRERCNFTTHTPVEAGHDRFGYDLVQHVLGDFIEIAVLKSVAGEDHLNMTQLALNLSEYVNGVAKRHAETSEHMFPGFRVRAVTNGVHAPTWAGPSMQKLFDAHVPGWRHEPEILVRADCCIPDDQVWQAHLEAKQGLVGHVRGTVGVELDPRLPIIGFARRMTAYKRPDLLFLDLGRLRAIARIRPFQIVLAGKAHPHDDGGKRSIEAIHRYRHALADVLPVVFLPNYDMTVAAALVSGCDLWVNTPLPPYEASGTSGMKA
ncbi:MAG: alpha-glucan family phosphorylase, partial [Burkholderiales bacterium]